ncbi:MAG: hypothetical protein AAB458_01525 [Patescibacteria group bacterium]
MPTEYGPLQGRFKVLFKDKKKDWITPGSRGAFHWVIASVFARARVEHNHNLKGYLLDEEGHVAEEVFWDDTTQKLIHTQNPSPSQGDRKR